MDDTRTGEGGTAGAHMGREGCGRSAEGGGADSASGVQWWIATPLFCGPKPKRPVLGPQNSSEEQQKEGSTEKGSF